MNLLPSSKYEVIHGKFACQKCEETILSCRYYKSTLDLTWKCKSCDHVSTVSIFKEKGY